MDEGTQLTGADKRDETQKSLLDLPDVALDLICRYAFESRIGPNGLVTYAGTVAAHVGRPINIFEFKGDLSIIDNCNYIRTHSIPILFKSVVVFIENPIPSYRQLVESKTFGVLRDLRIKIEAFKSNPNVLYLLKRSGSNLR